MSSSDAERKSSVCVHRHTHAGFGRRLYRQVIIAVDAASTLATLVILFS